MLPWIDSSGHIRSPYERTRIFDPAAKLWLANERPRDITAWEFGVLSDDWGAPESSKPIAMNEDEPAGTLVGYAVGSEAAALYKEQLKPLWLSFLGWLNEGSRTDFYWFSDELWHPREGWQDIERALEAGLFGECDFTLTETSAPRTYSGILSIEDLENLLDAWWPSNFGFLAGASVVGGAPGSEMDLLRQRGRVAKLDFGNLRQIFTTSETMDNLGFYVLSRGPSWSELVKELASVGWVDGAPIAYAT